ncbi:ISBma2, transposase [Bacillus sp. 1NLA3E]|nr:transposase [Bacillus sp. 1NLA3E]AGK55108.1 ISBma2, transposase [Bacillus sp. 1NLA3E]
MGRVTMLINIRSVFRISGVLKTFRFVRTTTIFVKTAFRIEKIELSFADLMEMHGLRYCRLPGMKNVSEQPLLPAACQKIKKLQHI